MLGISFTENNMVLYVQHFSYVWITRANLLFYRWSENTGRNKTASKKDFPSFKFIQDIFKIEMLWYKCIVFVSCMG